LERSNGKDRGTGILRNPGTGEGASGESSGREEDAFEELRGPFHPRSAGINQAVPEGISAVGVDVQVREHPTVDDSAEYQGQRQEHRKHPGRYTLTQDNRHRLKILESQKLKLEKEKTDYLNSLAQKVFHKLRGSDSKIISQEDLQEMGYFRFGNYMIKDIVHDYLYLVEDFLLNIQEKIRHIPNWIIGVYLQVAQSTLDRPLTDSDLHPFAVLLRIKICGDCLVEDYDNTDYLGE
jgi:predicted DNA-binding protein